MGTSTRPTLLTFPTKENTLVPVLCGTPDRVIPFRSVFNNQGDVGPGFHIIQDRGFAPQTLLDGTHIFGPGLAGLTLDRGEEGGGFPADKGAGPRLIWISKEKPVPRMFSPKRPRDRAWSMAMVRCWMAIGILGSDIDKSLVGSQGVGPDDHALQNGMGVSFHDGSIHKGPRVSFVPVADHINRALLFF